MGIRGVFLGVFLLGVPAAGRESGPDASRLLDRTLASPSASWTARVRVQVFGPAGAAGKAKAQTRRVCVGSPDSLRVEVAGRRSGVLSLLMVTDGRSLLTAWPTQRRGWLGPAPDVEPAQERARLDSLYELSVSTGGRAAKRPLWRLDLRSRADGRLRRSLWLDREDGRTLRREDYRPDGTLMRRERTTRLEGPSFSDEDFRVAAPAGVAVDASTVPFAGRASAESAFPPRFPRWAPAGFVPLAADVSARPVSARVSYTDGLTTFDFVERPAGEGARPDRARYAEVRLKTGVGILSFADGATVLSWTAGGRDYTATGDVPEADLARMADSIPDEP